MLSTFFISWEDKAISDLFINEQIRDKEVRVIGEDGEQLGIMSSKEALALADEAGLDLVKIAPTAKPPVCRIVDYGKYKYEQTRKEKDKKKNAEDIMVKKSRNERFTSKMRKKLALILGIYMVCFVILLARLIIINRDNSEEYKKQVLSQQEYDSVVLPAKRGEIVDCNCY